MKTPKLLVAALLAASTLSTVVSAAPISWKAAENTSAPTDIATRGTTVEAINGTNSNTGSVTVNGVEFFNSTLLPLSTGASFLAGASTGDANLDNLLDTLDFGGGAATTTINVGGGLLDAGADYLIQVFFTDLRSCCSSRTMIFGDGLGNTVGVDASTGGFGQFAVGTFTADAGVQTLSLAPDGFGNSHITAYQIRKIPEPLTIALLGLGLAGFGLKRRVIKR